jgi:hypothetical protein
MSLVLLLKPSAVSDLWYSVNPADNGSYSGTTVTITPPTMVRDDLVLVVALWRDPGNTEPLWPATPQVTGGQAWSKIGDELNSFGVSAQRYMCQFNGTWAADPQFGPSGVAAAPMIGFMMRVPHWDFTRRWLPQSQMDTTLSATVSPYDLTIPGQSIPRHFTTAFAEWHRDALNTYTLQTASWANAEGWSGGAGAPSSQFRNNHGSGALSLTIAWRVVYTAGPINSQNVTQRPDSGPWAGTASYMSFYEVPRKTPVIVKSQANRRRSRW